MVYRTVDSKGRISFSGLLGTIYLMSIQYKDGGSVIRASIAAMTERYFGHLESRFQQTLSGNDVPIHKDRMKIRMFYPATVETEADEQNRRHIPEYQREAAGIKPGKVHIMLRKGYSLLSNRPPRAVRITSIDGILEEAEQIEANTRERWHLIETL